jgi:microcystin-dependent protein
MNYVCNYQIGAIAYFAGEYAPLNWRFCDGHSLSVSAYTAVNAIFKGKYGGDAQQFNVPTIAPLISNGVNLPAMFIAVGLFPEHIPDDICYMSPEPDDEPTYIGLVVPYEGTTPPENWAWCDGSLIQTKNAQALASILLNRFGGDFIYNFALPSIPGHIICINGNFPFHPPVEPE